MSGDGMPDGEFFGDVDDAVIAPSDSPLHGLPRLQQLAVFGRERIVELSETKLAFAWEPVAAPGWFVMLAGPVGGGKTSLAFLLAVARANMGAPVRVLDRVVMPALEGTYVVIVEGEVDQVATARKLRRSCMLAGVDESALDRVIFVARKGVIVGDPTWLEIAQLIAAGKVSDVVLDTIARVAPGESNSEESQIGIFGAVAEAVEKAPSEATKPIVWVLAHKRKGSGVELDDVAGSVQRTAQIDSALIIQADRDECGKVLSTTITFAKLRHDPDEHPAPVTLTLTKTSATVGGIVRDDRPLEAQILDALRSGPQTKNALAKALRRSYADVEQAVRALFTAGRLRGASVQTKKGDYQGIALKDSK